MLASINALHAATDEHALHTALAQWLSAKNLGHSYALYYDGPVYGELLPAYQSSDWTPSDDQVMAAVDAAPGDTPRRLDFGDGQNGWGATLSFQGTSFGVLAGMGDDVELTDDREVQQLVSAVSTALVKLQMYDELQAECQRTRHKVDVLTQISSLLRNLDLDVLLASLLDLSLNTVGAEVGAILLRDGEKQLHTHAELGLPEDFLLSLRSRDGEPFCEQVLDAAQPRLIGDLSRDELLSPEHAEANLQALICLPLTTSARTLGLLVIANHTSGQFGEEELSVLISMGHLASAAIENAMLQQEQLESERIREQMSLARSIQASLLPQRLPELPELDIDGWCQNCDETGGDYYDTLPRGSRHLGLVIGDASGHGLGAALIMVAVRASILALLQTDMSLEQIFQQTNQRVEQDSHDDRYMTLFFADIDLEQRSLRYCSAGHDSPLHYRAATDEFAELSSTGAPIGMLPNWEYTLSEEIQLHRGDVIVLTTDGVQEAFNAAGEAFGGERLQRVIRDNAQRSAREVSQAICSAVLMHIGAGERTDDITVLVAVVR